ncbi:MAG: Arc family DNA-binding protein [Kiloniellaceae bacterium]
MATVTIRNLDDEVVAKLKQRAKAHHRSLEAELRVLLTDAASRPSTEEFRKQAERIAAMTPDVSQTDSASLIREDRDTDHGRDP